MLTTYQNAINQGMEQPEFDSESKGRAQCPSFQQNSRQEENPIYFADKFSIPCHAIPVPPPKKVKACDL
jgi:hypothetical protein